MGLCCFKCRKKKLKVVEVSKADIEALEAKEKRALENKERDVRVFVDMIEDEIHTAAVEGYSAYAYTFDYSDVVKHSCSLTGLELACELHDRLTEEGYKVRHGWLNHTPTSHTLHIKWETKVVQLLEQDNTCSFLCPYTNKTSI